MEEHSYRVEKLRVEAVLVPAAADVVSTQAEVASASTEATAEPDVGEKRRRLLTNTAPN